MEPSNYQLGVFFKEIEALLGKRATGSEQKSDFEEMVPIHGECYFIIDLTKSRILHFAGMKEMFGYEDKNIDLPFIFKKNHPEDSDLVQHIIKNIISKIVHIEIPVYTNIFSISSRFKKSNGEYVRILTDNFVIQADSNKIVQSILVRFTDLSFLDDSSAVDWKVDSNYLDKADIANEVYGEKKHVFTAREKEIVQFVLKGKSNRQIARKLNISEHTVATHRKNILSKSNCSGTEQLKMFCKKTGVFQGSNTNF